MLRKSDFFKVGFIRKTHGVKGEMMMLCETDTDFEQLGEWLFFNLDECLVPFPITSLRSNTDKTVLFSCKNINTVEEASTYIDTEIFLPIALKEDIVASDSPDALIGCKVIDDSNNTLLGSVVAFIEHPQNPLLEIENETQNILLPFQEEFILGFENQTLYVDLPEGLLDLD